MSRLYRYVPLRWIEVYLAAGWIPVIPVDPTHHCRHAVLCRACACHDAGGTA